MDLVPNAAQLFLPRLEGLVACLACWHALVQAGRKQLLTLPGRTFFNSLSCSEELCCLIFFFFFFFLNMFNVACWCCLLLPHCSLLGCAMFPSLGKVLYKLHRRYLIVWARPESSHSISNWRSSSLRGRSRRLSFGTLLMRCTDK